MDDEYVEAVLSLVESIPPGRAMSYGAVAEVVGASLERGGPRLVGAVMANYGGSVPWWRVVTASGRLPPGHEVAALRELIADGCPLTADGERVDMRRAAWLPAATHRPPPDHSSVGSHIDSPKQ
ncbi:MAG TPA: MGMT family protein [Jiangellaceae bacterium]|nr:MGMT family protein [Jiangellaceae bacterium]